MTATNTLTYEIAAPFILLRIVGAPVTAEVRRVLLTLSRDPQMPTRALLLVDAREATGLPTAASTRARFTYFRLLSGRVLPAAAIVTTATVASLLTGVLYKLEAKLRASIPVETFGDGESARRWLRERAAERRNGRPHESGPHELQEC